MKSMKMIHKFIKLIVCLLIAAVFVPFSAVADSYTYDSYGKTVNVPTAYEAIVKKTGANLGCGVFKNPSDLFVDKNGYIYIADTGNNRVVILNENMQPYRILENFTLDGEETYLSNPAGAFVDKDGRIFISDTDDERIICCNIDGKIEQVYQKPQISQFDETMFLPTSLLVDNNGNVYARCTGIYQGLIMFNSQGEYKGFFGSEAVKATASVRLQYLWKSLMNKEQKSQVSRYVPTEIKGIDIDSEGFIYTVAGSASTNGNKNSMDSIRKLNTKGSDILVNKMIKTAWNSFEIDGRSMNFTDISVDSDGFISLLDNRSGLLICFDPQMQLLNIIGGLDDELGKFRLPVAIGQYQNAMYVLDQSACAITKFELTPYGEQLHNAILLYNEGNYAETIDAWNNLIKLNSNCEIAYIGLGNAYLSLKEYDQAIECFKLGRDNEGYNEAYKYLRKEFINKYFIYIVVAAIVLVVAIRIFSKRRSGKNGAKA